jgi:uncharacterized RDD family membrane protein YckC
VQFCQECGAEHESWATVCVFCAGALGPEPPPPARASEHGTTDLYVGDLEPPQLHRLDLLLTSEGIPFMVGLGIRTVPTARAVAAEALIDVASRDEGDPVIEGFVDDGPAALRDQPDAGAVVLGDGPDSIKVLAGTFRRAWAQVLNTVLLGCLVSLVLAPLAQAVPTIAGTLQFVAYLVVCIAATAIWGRDLGQLLVKLQVVGEDGWPPSVGRAALRVVVGYGPVIALLVVDWLVYLAGVRAGEEPAWTVLTVLNTLVYFGWPVALLFSIAQDDEHQGWHDRVAGTWVVGTPPRRGRLGALRRAGPAIGAAAGMTAGVSGAAPWEPRGEPGPDDDLDGRVAR